MYAVIETGNRQYRVNKGDIIEVELLQGDKDSTIKLSNVLLIANDGSVEVGQPHVKGAAVEAKILDPNFLSDKVESFKYKNKTGYRRTIGHRQHLTKLKIEDIKRE